MAVNHVFFIRGLSTYGRDNARWSVFDFGPVYKHLAGALELRGVKFHPVLGLGAGTLPEIAARAAAFLDRHPVWNDHTQTVHLFGHSAGGLVVRLLLRDVKRPLAGALTVATPHLGSGLAEICVNMPVSNRGSALLLKSLGYNVGRKRHFFNELTAASLAPVFAGEPKPGPQVARVGSIVCSVPRTEWCLPLKIFYKIKAFDDFQTLSDGIVERDSQPYGEVIGEVPIDHFRQVGLFEDGRRFAQLCDLSAGFFKRS